MPHERVPEASPLAGLPPAPRCKGKWEPGGRWSASSHCRGRLVHHAGRSLWVQRGSTWPPWSAGGRGRACVDLLFSVGVLHPAGRPASGGSEGACPALSRCPCTSPRLSVLRQSARACVTERVAALGVSYGSCTLGSPPRGRYTGAGGGRSLGAVWRSLRPPPGAAGGYCGHGAHERRRPSDRPLAPAERVREASVPLPSSGPAGSQSSQEAGGRPAPGKPPTRRCPRPQPTREGSPGGLPGSGGCRGQMQS